MRGHPLVESAGSARVGPATFVARASLALALALALVSPAQADVSADAGPRDAYVEALVQRAKALELSRRKQWRRLGHWRDSRLSALRSEADGAGFFASPRGAVDPEAELIATLRAFFAAPIGDNEHAVCRFPARFAWLQRELGFDVRRIRQTQCPELGEFVASLGARSATVVFSSYYLSNAASAFGHTLLRINRQTAAAGDERRQLLDTGINYGADADTRNALLYAFKGLAGMFRGSFNRMPYYYKVREYNDFESRDLWEYELALSDDQLAMLVLHIWELGSTHFDYFYLSENCSYHILSALEVANPALDLVSQVKWPVIPADTIKALLSAEGLVIGVQYRPSLRTQFRTRMRGLDAAQRALVAAVLDDPEAPRPAAMADAEAARALDAALDMLDIRHGEEILTDTSSEPARHKLRLLARRAAIPFASPALSYDVPRDKSPHRGHGSRRLGLGAGLRGERPFSALTLRLALHDLADPAAGYPETSQLEFFPTELRYWHDDAALALERTSLVTIVNVVPLTRFDHNASWRADTGARRIYDRGCAGCLTGFVDLGGGVAVGAFSDRLTAFAMSEATVAYHPDLDGVVGPARLALGGSLGLRARLASDLVLVASGDLSWLPRQDPGSLWSASGTLRWQYFPDLALSAELRAEAAGAEAALLFLYYY